MNVVWWGLGAIYMLILATLTTCLAVCVWLDRRQLKRMVARQAADTKFANTQPVELIEAAEEVLKEGS